MMLRAIKSAIPQRERHRLRRLQWRIRGAFLAGNDVECPCCGGSFRRFLPFGVNETRANARCPRCGSLERHRLLWLYLRDQVRLFDGGSARRRLLHFAPEDVFRDAFRRVPTLDYITADLNSHKAVLRCDIQEIPLETHSVDVVFCSHVLEHVPDDRRAMRELRRVLRPSGWGIIQVPLKSELATTYEDPSIQSPAARLKAFGQSDHVRVYGRDYYARLEEAGFSVTQHSLTAGMSNDLVKRYALSESFEICLCRPS
jgi:SAM-dependent methyltransferase